MARETRVRRLTRRSAIALWLMSGTASLLAACAGAAPPQPAGAGQQAAQPAAAGATPPAAPTGTAPAPTPAGQTAESAPTPAGQSPAAGTTAPVAGKEQPRSGGTLRLGVLGDLQGLDGHLTTGLDTSRRIWDLLTQLDDKLDTVGVLAERFALSPDAKQMKLGLRKGVRWHTGRELTAEDVVWNFNRLKDPKVNPTYANLVKPFAQIEAPDPSTVVVRFDAANPFAVDALPALPMLDPVTFQEAGVNKPVGTGPFTFVEWVQGDHLTLKKNPNYWDTGKPYLDQLDVKIFSDPQAMIAQFEGGALDLALQPTLVDWARLRKAGQHQTWINENSGNYMALAYNVTQPPTDNKLARQALQFALDRKRIGESVNLGVEKALTLLWFPTSPAYDAAKNEAYAFDLDKARSLLGQAGSANLALDYNYSTAFPEHGRIGQIWQADLDKIGVKLTLKAIEPVALNSLVVGVKYQGVAVGTGFYGQLHGGVVWTSPYFGPVNNRSGLKDDRYTELTLAVYSETDPAKQKQAYAAWNEYVLDSCHVLAVSTLYPRAVATQKVRDASFNLGGNYLDLTGAWLA